MAVLDHVFIMCDVDAPGATALADLGVEEMASNAHPGQGTACRRFSLGDQYLELLWVNDPADAQSELTRPTQLWERWASRRTGACPFGLVFRPDSTQSTTPPFDTRSYAPAYLPSNCRIEVAADMSTHGPGCFFLPFVTSRPGRSPIRLGSNTLRSVTHVRIGMPGDWPVSGAVAWALASGLLSFEFAEDFRLTLALGHSRTRGRADLRPSLPLVLEW